MLVVAPEESNVPDLVAYPVDKKVKKNTCGLTVSEWLTRYRQMLEKTQY